jgi:hypothetical protein
MNFFKASSNGVWTFRWRLTDPKNFLFTRAYVPPSPPAPKFERIQGIKCIPEETRTWMDVKRTENNLKSLGPISNEDFYKKVRLKYETIFNWLCISFNGKEQFWRQLEQDYQRNVLDCYEVRLEEIINKWTSTDRKYWRTQKGISSRRKRTQLFQSEIFKYRRKEANKFYGGFKITVLRAIREIIFIQLTNKYGTREFEEMLLYSMAANCDMFGTGMMRFSEKQLYKKFLKVIEIPPLCYQDKELMFHIRFYARFLSLYVAKMKLDWARKEKSFKGEAIQEEHLRQLKNRMMIEEAWHKHFLQKCEKNEKAFKRGFESYTERWVKKKQCKVRKKKIDEA